MSLSEEPEILIFSDKEDFHVEFVVKRFPDDIPITILNLDHYQDAFTLEWHTDRGAICRRTQDDSELSLSSVRSIWWRRPFGIERRKQWPSTTGGAHPTLGFVYGLVGALSETRFVMNDLHRQFEADRKVRQMQVAERLGFSIPRSVIGSKRAALKQLRSNASRIVVKSHGGGSFQYGTRFLEDVGDDLCDLEAHPLIFQEFIPADREHRLIHVCGNVMGGTFDLRNIGDCADIRLLNGLIPQRAEIPSSIQDQIRKYCDILGLHYAAFDIREKNGVFYFLEANTCGEWLYVDACNDWKISRAVADALAHQHGSQMFRR